MDPLTFQVHDLQRENLRINQKLGTVSKDFEDLSYSENSARETTPKATPVYDPNDSKKPIFSLHELRDILQVLINKPYSCNCKLLCIF